MVLLFVYGTLKRGCKNHRQLAGQRFLGEARTVPGYRLYDLGDYPGMVEVPEDGEGVWGEIWAVDEVALARLDAFEGVGEGLYRREPVRLLSPHGGGAMGVETYLYVRNFSGRPALGSMWKE